MQAMILAAGFGTRLLPYTQYLPKPLFPVLNTPLLLATVKRLQSSGFAPIIVNCHHLGEQIVDCFQDIPGVIIQQENNLLDFQWANLWCQLTLIDFEALEILASVFRR